MWTIWLSRLYNVQWMWHHCTKFIYKNHWIAYEVDGIEVKLSRVSKIIPASNSSIPCDLLIKCNVIRFANPFVAIVVDRQTSVNGTLCSFFYAKNYRWTLFICHDVVCRLTPGTLMHQLLQCIFGSLFSICLPNFSLFSELNPSGHLANICVYFFGDWLGIRFVIRIELTRYCTQPNI